jgi:hypothetical protein
MRDEEMPDLQSSKATHSRFGNGLLQKISTMRSTVWRPKAAFPSTRWTGSPTFGSRLGPIINGYENANPNIPTRLKTAALHRLRKSAASCRPLRIALFNICNLLLSPLVCHSGSDAGECFCPSLTVSVRIKNISIRLFSRTAHARRANPQPFRLYDICRSQRGQIL